LVLKLYFLSIHFYLLQAQTNSNAGLISSWNLKNVLIHINCSCISLGNWSTFKQTLSLKSNLLWDQWLLIINKDKYNVDSFARLIMFYNRWWSHTTKDEQNLTSLSIRLIILTLKELCQGLYFLKSLAQCFQVHPL